MKDFFAAGSLLREATAARAIEGDRKVFEENGWRISISQIEEMGLDEFLEKAGPSFMLLWSRCAPPTTSISPASWSPTSPRITAYFWSQVTCVWRRAIDVELSSPQPAGL